jgi:hypothetical protein
MPLLELKKQLGITTILLGDVQAYPNGTFTYIYL